MPLTTKKAIITGAAGGLGWGVTRVLLKQGTSVLALDGDLTALKHLADELGNPPALTLRETNILDEAQVAAAFKEAGGLDILVNLIGGFTGGPVTETTVEDWDRMMNLNLKSVFLSCKHAFPWMTANGGGRIVNVGARPALQPVPELGAYSASKAGVTSLTQTLALEGQKHGINVNAVLPSIIDTPANRGFMPDEDFDTWVKPEKIGEVIGFLCSDASSATSGALVPVYGRA